jgi:hypothetical protein
MVTGLQQNKVKSVKVDFSDEAVTSFGGLALVERLALRAGLWRRLEQHLPERRGYSWMSILKSVIMGLLSGSRGTYAAEELREDEALIALLGLEDVPEEATVWRSLQGMGEAKLHEVLAQALQDWTRELLKRAPRRDFLREGFFPVFGDGTLLEGSRRREGTKYIEGKGEGLMWTTIFAGPFLAAQQLAMAGEGEQSSLRQLLPEVVEKVLKPTGLKSKALLLLDSLHGDGPTLDLVEEQKLHYIIGANKLSETARILSEQPSTQWLSTGPRPQWGWSESAVCVCWIECAGWSRKRTLVGRRWVREGEMIYNYSGVITDLEQRDLTPQLKRGLNFSEAVWRLYDGKAGCENYFKDLLEDLGLHHPPCQEHTRNVGFYAAASLAYNLGVAVDLLGGRFLQRGSKERLDGGKRRRPTPKRMRLWRLRRRLFALPGRIACHARQVTVTLLGLGAVLRREFDEFWRGVCTC